MFCTVWPSHITLHQVSLVCLDAPIDTKHFYLHLWTKGKVPEFFKYPITKSLLVLQLEPHDVGTTDAKELWGVWKWCDLITVVVVYCI